MGVLGRLPERQLVLVDVVLGDRAPRFQGDAGDPLGTDLALDDPLGPLEGALHVAGPPVPGYQQVVSPVGFHQHRAGLQGGPRVGHGGQYLVGDIDQADRLEGGVLGLRHDRGHRFAHVADPVRSEGVPVDALGADLLGVPGFGDGAHPRLRFGPGHDVDDAVEPLGRRSVDRDDPSGRVGAAEDGQVSHAGENDVGDEQALPGRELAVGQAEVRLSYVSERTGGGHLTPHLLPTVLGMGGSGSEYDGPAVTRRPVCLT